MGVRVAVVGAGPLGLMATKNLKEDGFEVTTFEKRAWLGGLWKKSDDSTPSVSANTIFNGSRFASAITDFPFPEHHDDFPTAAQLFEYLNAYADHFDIRKYVRLNTEIRNVRRIDEKWEVKSSTQGSDPQVEYFDKVMICSGSFNGPRYPTIDNIEAFEGKKMHAIQFNGEDATKFKDQRVLLIGLHATSQDITCELRDQASKVYIAHRTGVVMLPRWVENGRTFDQIMTLGFFLGAFQFMSKHFPTMWNAIADYALRSMSRKAFPNQLEEWGLSPAPSIAVGTPIVATELFPLMESGFATPVSAVQRVTGSKQVTLTDGRVLDDIDAIIYCTGYYFDIPQILPKEYHPYPVKDESPVLYRNIFPLHPDPAVRNSLAFVGQAGFPLPGFQQFELYGIAVSQIWQGKSKLPPLSEMEQWYHEHLAWRERLTKQYKHVFYKAFVRPEDMMPWINETAGTGMYEHTSWFSWKAWQFWWEDPKFYKLVTSGLFAPPVWRLFDMGKRKVWSGAREQIIKDNEFAAMRARVRLEQVKREAEEKKVK